MFYFEWPTNFLRESLAAFAILCSGIDHYNPSLCNLSTYSITMMMTEQSVWENKNCQKSVDYKFSMTMWFPDWPLNHWKPKTNFWFRLLSPWIQLQAYIFWPFLLKSIWLLAEAFSFWLTFKPRAKSLWLFLSKLPVLWLTTPS